MAESNDITMEASKHYLASAAKEKRTDSDFESQNKTCIDSTVFSIKKSLTFTNSRHVQYETKVQQNHDQRDPVGRFGHVAHAPSALLSCNYSTTEFNLGHSKRLEHADKPMRSHSYDKGNHTFSSAKICDKAISSKPAIEPKPAHLRLSLKTEDSNDRKDNENATYSTKELMKNDRFPADVFSLPQRSATNQDIKPKSKQLHFLPKSEDNSSGKDNGNAKFSGGDNADIEDDGSLAVMSTSGQKRTRKPDIKPKPGQSISLVKTVINTTTKDNVNNRSPAQKLLGEIENEEENATKQSTLSTSKNFSNVVEEDSRNVNCGRAEKSLPLLSDQSNTALKSNQNQLHAGEHKHTSNKKMFCKEQPTVSTANIEHNKSVKKAKSKKDHTLRVRSIKSKCIVKSKDGHINAESPSMKDSHSSDVMVSVKIPTEMTKTKARDYLCLLSRDNFNLSIKYVSTVPNRTWCILEFIDISTAEKFVDTIKESTQTSLQAYVVHQDVTNVYVVSRLCDKIDELSADFITKHENKMAIISQNIRKMKVHSQALPPIELQKNKEIEKSLRGEIDDLKLQNGELCKYIDLIKKEAEIITNGQERKKQTDNLLRRLGIELARFDKGYPMYNHRYKIIETLSNNQVTIILGETGSGKSTQLTQYLYEAGFAKNGIIVCTQPRKVAATSLATRVAQELGTSLGKTVGYQVGSKKNYAQSTAIIYLTDHILLNECLKDPFLKKYSCVIIDEAHERSINTDLLIGMVKRCLKSRPDLRVVITSATIDPQIFCDYFEGCPVLKVSGRMFPVDVVYQPGNDSLKGDGTEEVAEMAFHIHKTEGPGDILAFLATPLATEKALEKFQMLSNHNKRLTEPLVLHGKLQPADQEKVFELCPPGVRKVIFATNCAETSITIDGVRYVIDSGRAKENVYDPRRNMSKLIEGWTTKSSAEQRKGRAGRTQEGKCVRLYSAELYNSMDTLSRPEILRVHLGQALLRLLALGIESPTEFDYIQAPDRDSFCYAFNLLEYLGAVENGAITEMGQKLAALPLQPQLGSLVLNAINAGMPCAGLLVACLQTLGSIFFRAGSEEDKKMADKLKLRFCVKDGDIITMVRVYREWKMVPEKNKNKWCKENSINAKSMRIVRETMKEIKTTLHHDLNILITDDIEEQDEIQQKLPDLIFQACGRNLAIRRGAESGGYTFLDQGGEFFTAQLHPSCVLNFLGYAPRWVIFSELLKTSRDFLVTVTAFENVNRDAFPNEELRRRVDLLQSQKLSLLFLATPGKRTMNGLCGQRYTNIPILQKSMEADDAVGNITIEASKNLNKFEVYGKLSNKLFVQAIMSDAFTTARKAMDSQRDQIPIEDGSKTKCIIEKGGKVAYILMADEFCTITLRNVPWNISATEVIQTCKGFGTLTDSYQFNEGNGKNENIRWGKITFSKPSEAQSLMDNKEKLPFDAYVPQSPTHFGNKIRGLHINLRWRRMLNKGIGFADFPCPSDAAYVMASLSSITFGDTMIVVKPGKRGNSIYMRGVPKEASQEDVKHSIELNLDRNVKIGKVTLPLNRDNPVNLSCQDIRNCINGIIGDDDHQNYDVRITPPKDGNPFGHGQILFEDTEQGNHFLQEVGGNLCLYERLIHLSPETNLTLNIPINVYESLTVEIDALIKNIQENCSKTRIFQQRYKYSIFVHVKSSDVEKANVTFAKLRDIVKCSKISVTNDKVIKQLRTGPTSVFFRRVEHDSNSIISFNSVDSTIDIYGSTESQAIAIVAINEFMEQCTQGESKTFPLKGETKPLGMMKGLLNTYGVELIQFQQKTGAQHVSLDFRHHILHVIGSEDILTRVQEELNNLQKDLPQIDVNDEDPSCNVCLCPVEAKSVYYTESCGHPYCKECIEHFINNAITKKELPLLCIAEDCNKELLLQDIYEIIGKTPDTKNILCAAAVESLMKTNKDYQYCITADCKGVYRVSPSGNGKAYTCDLCNATLCTSCCVDYHHGRSCEMFQGMKRDDNFDLNTWMKGRDNVKQCPNCKRAIEKRSGCNRMHCIMCKIYFCWKCCASFNSEKETYDHLASNCGGIF